MKREDRYFLHTNLESFVRACRRRKLFRRVVAALCALVVLFTMDFLEESVIAMTGDDLCSLGFLEHAHSEACYQPELVCGLDETDPIAETIQVYTPFAVHVHTEACRDENGNIVCGYVEKEYYHTHNSYCYDASGRLVCGLETKTEHIHTEACYLETQVLICSVEEAEGHAHTDNCYRESRELTCGQEESAGHVHDASCYRAELICGEEAGEDHTHTDGCYTEVLTCGKTEGEGAHSHSEDCYTISRELICGLEETEGHTHTEACYKTESALICGQDMAESVAARMGLDEVRLHVHNPKQCFTTITRKIHGEDVDIQAAICGYMEVQTFESSAANWTEETVMVDEGHTHTENCYAIPEEPNCGLIEHAHTLACLWTNSTDVGEDAAAETPVPVVIEEPTKEPATEPTEAPEDVQTEVSTNYSYIYNSIGESVSYLDILSTADRLRFAPILIESISVDDMDAVSVQEKSLLGIEYDYILTAKGYFDRVILTITTYLGDGLAIALSNPAPEPSAAPTVEPTEEPTAQPTEHPSTVVLEAECGASISISAEVEFPEGVEFTVEAASAPESAEEALEAEFGDRAASVRVAWYDISLGDLHDVPVTITLPDVIAEEDVSDFASVHAVVLHALSDGTIDVITDSAVSGAAITFTTPSLSTFGVAYTVDFHFELDGKEYVSSIVGGDGMSLKSLIEQLHILDDASRLIREIDTITVSLPELFSAVKIEKDTTLGTVRAELGYDDQYSAEFTEAEIAQMNAAVLTAPDWAIISHAPFTSEESLTIRLSDGETFEIRVTDAQSNGVTYAVSANATSAKAGEKLPVTFTASVEAHTGLFYVNRYVYVLIDEDQANCPALAALTSGQTLTVPTAEGGSVTLHKADDGFWYALDAIDGEDATFTLDFTTASAAGEEPEEAGVGIYMGAGYVVLGVLLSARGDASSNRNLAGWGYADASTYVNLTWTKEEVDPEPAMEDEFTVAADEIYGYFHTELPATFHAVAGRGSENNVFYVRNSPDRAEVDILKNAQSGDIVPAVDAAGNPVTDRYGEQLMLHVTEDGFYFELDNTKHNNYANFSLAYKAADNADAVSSNPAKMRVYIAQDASEEAAGDAARARFSPNLSLTWSDSGDKMHYAINLIWDTSVEENKYNQSVVTTSQATLEPKYILDLLTSSVNYEAGEFEMRLPYALWPYRGSEATGSDAAIPTDFSIPREGDALNGSLFHYRIEYDPDYPNDKTRAQLVITNAEYLPAGTNARITVKYSVDPWKTVDLSEAELTVLATAQATNQSSPEYGESNTITYRLDTGFNNTFLNKTSTWTSTEAVAVYSKPTYLADEYWDPDNYNTVRFHISYGANGYNQPLDLSFLATLPEGAELVMVTPHTGGSRPIAIDTETGTWERSISAKSLSSSDGDYWFYVRFPRESEGDADYHVRLDMDATAHDPDSHTPPEDYNDLDHNYLEWDFHWKDYEFKPVGTESYSKAGWGDDYIEVIKATETDVEFNWRMYVTTLSWYLEDGEMQYVQMTDDAHFWTYVPSYYGTNDYRNSKELKWMDGDTYELSRITSISIQYYDLSHRDGSTIYPDFPGGQLIVQGSKDGITWDTVQTIDVPAMTGRTGQYISVPNSGKYEFEPGSGYTRLRIISPEAGRGSLTVSVDFYTRMKSGSELVTKWLDECADDQKVYIRNYAAYQHYTREYRTETVLDEETGEEKTVKTGELGEYIWDNPLTSPYSPAKTDGSADGKSLADRDVEENQYSDGSQTGYLRRAYAGGVLRHFTYSAQMQKTTLDTINDTPNQRAIVPFKIFEEEIVSGKTGEKYDAIYKDFSQDSGKFYDLLPPGYRYLEGTADAQTVRGLNASVSVSTIDDYRGSGRQMVIFSVSKPSDPGEYTAEGDTNIKNQGTWGYIFGKTTDTQYKSNYIGNYHTGFMITFSAYIPWKDLADHPNEVNLVSFQRTDGDPIRAGYSDQGYPDRQRNFPLSDSQVIKEFKGTAATSRAIDYDKSTTAAFDGLFSASGGVRASGPSVFTDVDGNGSITPKSSLYAYSTANPQVVDGVQTGIYKRVLGDEGQADLQEGGEGWNTLDRTTLGGHYQYKITTYASMGEMYGLIVYDTLEDAKNKEGASGEVTWKGVFDSVDVSEAIRLGFAPVVYYSTATLDYNTITGDKEYTWIDNSSIWTTECPADKSTVKAIAVDLRKMADGSDAKLRARSGEDDPDIDQVSFIINMTAPEYFPSDARAVYAINRPAYSCYQKGFFSAEGIFKNDIGLRVKIRLPINVRIKKVTKGYADTPADTKFMLKLPSGHEYPFTYADFDENGEFVFDDQKLAAYRAEHPEDNTIPQYVQSGVYAIAEDADSANVDGMQLTVTYDEGTNGAIDVRGKTDDQNADAEKQNVITITNNYAGETVGLTILKVDAADRTKPLSGAVFTLTKVTEIGAFQYDGTFTPIASQATDAEGKTAFAEIPAGYYEIAETTAPAGYVLTGHSTAYIRVEQGEIKLVRRSAEDDGWEEIESTGDELIAFTPAAEGSEASFTIANQPGAMLPNTGGSGRNLFAVPGGLLLLLALAGLMIQKSAEACKK